MKKVIAVAVAVLSLSHLDAHAVSAVSLVGRAHVQLAHEKIKIGFMSGVALLRGTRLQDGLISTGDAQTFVRVKCAMRAEALKQLREVDVDNYYFLPYAVESLTAMKCDENWAQMGFTNLEDILALDRSFFNALTGLEAHVNSERRKSEGSSSSESKTESDNSSSAQ